MLSSGIFIFKYYIVSVLQQFLLSLYTSSLLIMIHLIFITVFWEWNSGLSCSRWNTFFKAGRGELNLMFKVTIGKQQQALTYCGFILKVTRTEN